MNFGTFEPYEESEYFEFMMQVEILQLTVEELWAQAAEAHLQEQKMANIAVMLTDRDVLNGMLWTSPLHPGYETEWVDIKHEMARRLGRGPIIDQELAARYELGAVLLQTLAPTRSVPRRPGRRGTRSVFSRRRTGKHILRR